MCLRHPERADTRTDKLLTIEAARGNAALLVPFFFVLSGYIIYYIHHADLDRPGRLGASAWKRAIRIVAAETAGSLRMGRIGALLLTGAVAVACVAALVVHRCVEKPVAKWLRNVWARRGAAPAFT